VSSAHVRLQLVAVEAEPGVVPPAGNINLFEFHLERPERATDAGVAGPAVDAR